MAQIDPVQFRKLLSHNATVMVCRHMWEDSSCKVVLSGAHDFDFAQYLIERHSTPTKFTREDGTTFVAQLQMRCPRCARMHVRSVDFIEATWKHGMLYTSDFLRPDE